MIAYFSGTGSHNRDFEIITEPLIWVLETYPRVWLHINGHLELGPEFSPFHTRIRRAPCGDATSAAPVESRKLLEPTA